MTKILLIDNHFYNNERFNTFFTDSQIIIVSNDLLPFLDPKALTNIDLIVSSGSEHDLIQEEYDKRPGWQAEINLIQNTTIPFLGICFGHQMVAKAFDSEIISTPKIIRFETIKITDPNFSNLKNPIVWEYHKFSISKLSDQMESLAIYEPFQTHEIIKHKTKPIWGTQFHPERDPQKQDGRLIIRNILDQMGLTRIEVIT